MKSDKLYSNPPTLERDEDGKLQVVTHEPVAKEVIPETIKDMNGFMSDLKQLISKYGEQ